MEVLYSVKNFNVVFSPDLLGCIKSHYFFCLFVCFYYGSSAVSEIIAIAVVTFDLKEAPRWGRPTQINDDKIKTLIQSVTWYMTQKITETLKISQNSVHIYLKKLGYVSKLDIWVAQINICDILMKCEENYFSLKWMVASDEVDCL